MGRVSEGEEKEVKEERARLETIKDSGILWVNGKGTFLLERKS